MNACFGFRSWNSYYEKKNLKICLRIAQDSLIFGVLCNRFQKSETEKQREQFFLNAKWIVGELTKFMNGFAVRMSALTEHTSGRISKGTG